MFLIGYPNPFKLQQIWECTFLKVFDHTKTKLASKQFFSWQIQNYQLTVTANSALMGHIGHLA